MYQIVVLGELCEDILLHAPQSVEVLGQKIWAKDITITAGGSAAYASQALARMGAKVSLCSVLGDDEAGGRILRIMRDFGVDCSLIKLLDGARTTASIVLCDKAQKNFQGCSPMLPMHLPDLKDIESAGLLYIAGYTIYPELWTAQTVDFLKAVRERGVKIALDVQLLPVDGVDIAAFSRLDRVLPLTDFFFCARKDARGLFGSDDAQVCMGRLTNMNFQGTAIFKRGCDGCIVAQDGDAFSVPGYPAEAYDTVGSGDIFGAGYCFGVLRGWDDRQCAEFAAIYTALSIGEYRHVKNYPNYRDVEALLPNAEKEMSV